MASRGKKSKPLAPPQSITRADGILLVDKERGPTSHDMVDRIRKRFGFRKVGHGGTLDPQATGLLVILVGRGTKYSSRFVASDKTYEGTLRLGVSTDTQDSEGKVVAEAGCSGVTRAQLEEAMATFRGDLFQVPPMASAVKVDGVPLYKRARRGETVEREPKLIHVYEFRLVDVDLPRATFFLACTKGTYVRTLCSDVGDALGCGAYLEALRRTRCGDLDVEDAVPSADLDTMTLDALCARLIPLEDLRVR
jgi:tRNA pseudouridine55 synthase